MAENTTGDVAVATEDRSIGELIAGFVDATTAAFEQTGASEEVVETVESTGEAVVEAVEDAHIVADEGHGGSQDDHGGSVGTEAEGQSREEITDGEDTTDNLADRVEHLAEEVNDLAEPTTDRDDSLREQVDRTSAWVSLNLEEIADLESDIEELDERMTAVENGDVGENGTDADRVDRVEPQTYLEDVARVPPRLTDDLHPNVKRALFVARDVREYSTSVQNGRIIKSSQMWTILEAGCDGGHHQTVKRVFEILDDFGEDEVKIVDKDHLGEKRVWFSDETVDRLDELCGEEPGPTHDVVSRAKG